MDEESFPSDYEFSQDGFFLPLFDEMLSSACYTCRTLAPLARESQLSPVERAVVDLVPTSISIALSIRELLRQSYVPSAKILIRPLIERAAVVDYLVNEPEAIELWEAGWKYRKRPSLAKLVTRMTGTDTADECLIKALIEDFNSVVHAEPEGCRKFIFEHPDQGRIYSLGRTKGADEMAVNVASAAAMAVTFLASNAKRAFRERTIAFARTLGD